MRKNVSARVNACVFRDEVKNNKLLNQIMRHKSIDLDGGKMHLQEARRIQ